MMPRREIPEGHEALAPDRGRPLQHGEIVRLVGAFERPDGSLIAVHETFDGTTYLQDLGPRTRAGNDLLEHEGTH